MLIGRRLNPLPAERVYFVLCFGQSNMNGRTPTDRLANTQYNYKGIADGYPAVRTTQGQYSTTPSGVYTYFKTTDAFADQSIDNGAWQALNVGVNNAHNAGQGVGFVGPELSLCTKLNESTGREVRLIKVGFGSTGLTNTISNGSPGNWNNTIRFIAIEYYVKRALRDFRAAFPNKRPVLVGVNWWQGETDANQGINQATYEAQFESLRQYFVQELNGIFVIQRPPIWNLVRLDYLRTSGETGINAALQAIITANSADFRFIDSTPYPQNIELTSGEAAPVAVGTPNSLGFTDDEHSSYIAQLAVGERMADNILARFS